RKHEEMNQREDDEWHEPERKSEVLADRIWKRFLCCRGEAAGHLHEKNHHDRRQEQRPEQLKAKVSARLRARGDVADVEEPADARQDAERELHRLLHLFCSSCCSAALAVANWRTASATVRRSFLSIASFT